MVPWERGIMPSQSVTRVLKHVVQSPAAGLPVSASEQPPIYLAKYPHNEFSHVRLGKVIVLH